MTSAALAALLGFSGQALALALGAASVKSYLGQPLRAEIEVPEITSQEAATFKASVASPKVFQTSGVTYSADLAGTRISLRRRANGQAYLRVEGARPINEPFLAIVIEADWGAGQVVRDYTMLIDPPNHGPATVVTTQPQVQAQAAQPAAVAAQAKPAAPQENSSAVPPSGTPAAAPGAGSGDQVVTVRRGDTASSILRERLPAGISLDQMLIALQRGNPNAFIRGNVNLIKAGAVLNLPTAEQAGAMTEKQARQAVRLQTGDFLAYRRGVAAHATQAAAAPPPGQSSSGTIQPQVQNAAQPKSPDRLHVGGGSGSSTETKVAQGRRATEQKRDAGERAENIKDLNQILQGASSPAPAKKQPPPAAKQPGGVNVPIGSPAPARQAASMPSVVPVPAPASAASQAANAASQEQAPPPPVKKPMAPPPPSPEPSILDTLSDNLLPIGGGLVAILLLVGAYLMARSRKNKAASFADESLFTESQAQPDSFFAASGGQQVDTSSHESAAASRAGASSMVYSPSQLDAAGDVDPVAEADVYLAYGRDMQAEEILKEALRTHPGRAAVYRKLAEIYSKRRDVKALETLATEARGVTGGTGADWDFIAKLGNSLDPDNSLYAPSDKPRQEAGSPVPTLRHAFGADTQPYTEPPAAPSTPAGGSDSAMDLDLDLDADSASVPLAPVSVQPPPAAAPAPIKPTEPAPLDFDLSDASAAAVAQPEPAAPARAEVPRNSGNSMIDFDMSALSVNPDSRSGGNTRHPGAGDDPMGTKLSLAQEFQAIGDTEGARTLLKEVIAQATGTTKAQAERFLSELD